MRVLLAELGSLSTRKAISVGPINVTIALKLSTRRGKNGHMKSAFTLIRTLLTNVGTVARNLRIIERRRDTLSKCTESTTI